MKKGIQLIAETHEFLLPEMEDVFDVIPEDGDLKTLARIALGENITMRHRDCCLGDLEDHIKGQDELNQLYYAGALIAHEIERIINQKKSKNGKKRS